MTRRYPKVPLASTPKAFVRKFEEAGDAYCDDGDLDLFIVRMETLWRSVGLAKPKVAAGVVKKIAPRLARSR